MSEKSIDMKVSTKLKEQGYKDKDINYGYLLPSSGNKDFIPDDGKLYHSKSGKTTRAEFEYLVFAGKGKNRTERLILIENKDTITKLGKVEDIGKEVSLYKLAVTDGFFYAHDILSKTEKVKSVFVLAVAGDELETTAIFVYKHSSIIDKYSKQKIYKYDDEISYIFIEKWNDWDQLEKNKFNKYINEEILGLNSPDNEINLAHIRIVAGKLSNTIDKKLKLDPFKRLLLVSGLLLGINEDENVIKYFSKSSGGEHLYTQIKDALPEDKFSSDKKDQLLNSFRFIKSDKKITKELINPKTNKSEGYPLALIAKELSNVITLSDTVNSDETLFYQEKNFIGFSHVNKLVPKYENFNKYHALYVISAFKKAIRGKYDYGTKFTEHIEATEIELPVSDYDSYEPNWKAMEKMIQSVTPKYLEELERQGQEQIHKIHDKQSGIIKLLEIENLELTSEDREILSHYPSKKWESIKVSDIFDKISRGKRLIEAHRIAGKLPFITAGVNNQGISSYISNSDVEIFPANSLTIDMFGKVFYRNFEYGADDHVAIMYKEDNSLSRMALLFIAPIIKQSILGKFDYDQNFYASDVYDITIKLPFLDKKPDWEYMEKFSEIMVKKSLKKYEQEIALLISKFLET
ncbi:restriction endonuclease subunit S [Streptococcus sp. E24BD]|uniref:restriction endonuclease subunit S n=1 Tax=Streptococcus sp. E24BD TaxID=3278715 RepID=UPI00359ED88E